MSEKRLQKLLYLKEREEMKDALVRKVKEAYFAKYPEAAKRRGLDQIVDGQVTNFVGKKAKLSKENLDKLLKNVENEAEGGDEEEKRSHVSE